MRYKGAGAELDEWLPANALQVRPQPTVPALTEMRVWLTRLTTRSTCALRSPNTWTPSSANWPNGGRLSRGQGPWAGTEVGAAVGKK